MLVSQSRALPPVGYGEEEERLYLQLETRERVQSNEAKSKGRRGSGHRNLA